MRITLTSGSNSGEWQVRVDADDGTTFPNGEVPLGQVALILNNVSGMLLNTFLSQSAPRIALPTPADARAVKAMVAASVEEKIGPLGRVDPLVGLRARRADERR